MNECRECGQTFDIESYPKYWKSSVGYLCLQCSRKRHCLESKLYRKRHPDKIKTINKRYSEKRTKNRIERRKQLFSLKGNKCEICGFSDERALEIHHKNGIKKYKLDYLAKKNDPSQYMLICANCHKIRHAETFQKREPFVKLMR